MTMIWLILGGVVLLIAVLAGAFLLGLHLALQEGKDRT